MKKLLLLLTVFLIAVIFVPQACNDKPAKSAEVEKSDTSKIIAVYADPDRVDIVHEIMYRVIAKNIRFDSSSMKGSWVIDTFYFRPKIDTVINATTKRPELDSLGKIKVKPNWIYTEKKLVWDTGITTDSAISRFKKYLVPDTTQKIGLRRQ